ncbi:MAG: phosphoribosylformylglycinamidine cyclo-ligase [archaeon]|nr:phosphoribosylformylglycinamidine cyclo-ligase [archaeon]
MFGRGLVMEKDWTYSKSGVDIDKKSCVIAALVGGLKCSRDGVGRVMHAKNLFAGLIDFGDKYLTMATDGVGTKILVAKELGIWDTIGIDCIAMNVNDTICVGAEPVSFVDYIAVDKPDEKIFESIGCGLSEGAILSNIEVAGGEVAILPEMVNGLDISGTCLGYVSKDKVITGSKCSKGDLIVSLKSSGIHSNGLTLARKVFESAGYKLTEKISGLSKSIGEELLIPTEIYVKQILDILKKYTVHGLVDITGGGLRNILRMNPRCRYNINDPIKPNPIFKKIQEIGNISMKEAYQTFNMGMGFDIIAPEEDAESIVKEWKNAKITGVVEDGEGVSCNSGSVLYDHY